MPRSKKLSEEQLKANAKESARKYRERHRDYYRKKAKEVSKEVRAARFRKHRFGLSEDQFRKLLTDQNGLCAICKKELNPPCVDHCHVTGEVRGLLCRECNAGIGLLQDSEGILENALAYLRRV